MIRFDKDAGHEQSRTSRPANRARRHQTQGRMDRACAYLRLFRNEPPILMN